MKIAYIYGPEGLFASAGNGIKMQGKIWGEELQKRGHEVTFIDTWSNYKVDSFDIIHIFGYGPWINNFINKIRKVNSNIVLSPIIDSIEPPWKIKIASLLNIPFLRLSTLNNELRKACKNISSVFVRSNYEKNILLKGYGVNEKKIEKVPLSNRIENFKVLNKENFCLHVSSICDERKNVKRLIKAAIKYQFKLIIAGNPGPEYKFKEFKELIGDNENIIIKGFVTKDELTDLYARAKVFALPSILEGVGLVGLEAASFGCNIVITELGGPKEYYSEYAYTVNPFSIDDIGKNIIRALEAPTNENLINHIKTNYSTATMIDKLESAYHKLLNE